MFWSHRCEWFVMLFFELKRAASCCRRPCTSLYSGCSLRMFHCAVNGLLNSIIKMHCCDGLCLPYLSISQAMYVARTAELRAMVVYRVCLGLLGTAFFLFFALGKLVRLTHHGFLTSHGHSSLRHSSRFHTTTPLPFRSFPRG
jgi:hypothetical protein